MKLYYLIPFIPIVLFGCSERSVQGCFPEEHLPDYITPLTDFGQRSEWSLDGNFVFFVDSAGGDVWRVDIRTRETSRITKPEHRPPGDGYYRVLCMSNGDLLLTCGPERYELYMQVMDKGLEKHPVNIPDEMINEGPALSRKSMKIAWSPNHKIIFSGEITYRDGIPWIVNKKLLVDNKNVVVNGVKYEDILEPQDWRPPEETELIWSQYGHDSRGVFTSELMGYDTETETIINYSRAPMQYDEPEGIFPDGEYTLVESDKHHPEGTAYIDIYKFKLDTADREYTRLTYFSEVKGYRSSNPVVRDDGKLIAFQASVSGSAAGAGCGIYLFDLEKFNADQPE